MLFSELAKYLEKLEKTSSRLEITGILADLFKKASAEEIDKVCYLCLGELAPKYIGLELNLAEKMMLKVISQVSGESLEQTVKDFKKTGDLGEVILAKKGKGGQSKLTVSQVYERLVNIAGESGTGSQERKIKGMVGLIQELDGLSAKYVARIPVKKLRLGFSDLTVLDALSWMKTKDKSLRKELEEAFNVWADIGKIARLFKNKGLKGVRAVSPAAGVPIRVAKAVALKKPKEILEKMGGRTALEPKLDGFRVQIHLDRSQRFKLVEEQNLSLFKENKHLVRIFSRNLDNMTHMFPEVVKTVQKLKIKSAILDGEAIAVNPRTGRFLPFQETVQRKRKHKVAEKAKEIPLKVFIFDLLYLNGRSLLKKPFSQRRRFLEELLKKGKGENLVLNKQRVVDKPEDFDDFFKEVVEEGLEGLVAKKLEATYQAGARNFVWIKYKAGMKSELADTIDCVVIGYYRGKGKRNQFGIGAFLVGVPDKKGRILTVSKVGTGLTDVQWREMNKRGEKLETAKMPKEYRIAKNLRPDVWCRPQLVVEIEADTITRSPIHTAGLALRFPRLKRFRDDKKVSQATSLKQLKLAAKI